MKREEEERKKGGEKARMGREERGEGRWEKREQNKFWGVKR